MDALAEARKRLSSRIADPKILMLPGLKDDLRTLLGAFDALDRRTSMLAAVVLQKHYWPGCRLLRAEIESLTAWSTDAAAVKRAAEHGDNCTCEACFRGA